MYWIPIHDLSGLEEENIVYRSYFFVLYAVLMSRCQFLRLVRGVCIRESRLDSK